MKNPKVTVLMPVYNSEKYLHEAIKSILNQTFRDFEFIIIHDPSTDKTAEILQSFNDTRIKIINNAENIGLIESLNKGLELAEGKYIARMDSDDISFQNRLEKQIDFIEQNPQVAVVGGAVVWINDQGVPSVTARFPLHDQQIKETLLSCGCCIAHPTTLIRTKTLRAVGGYRKAFLNAEDYDLWLRLADSCELANLSDPVLYLRAHGNQVSSQKLRQQIISSIGALTAAKIRRETCLDPLDEEDIVTIDLLSKLGVQDEFIQKKIIEGHLFWVVMMHTMGDKTAMLQYLNETQNLISSHKRYDFGDLIGNCYLNCAAISYRQGKYCEGAGFLVKTFFLNPHIIKKAPKWFFQSRISMYHKIKKLVIRNQ